MFGIVQRIKSPRESINTQLLDNGGLIINYLGNRRVGGSRGIRRVYLIEASNSVVDRGLGQADGKMNEAVGMKNSFDNSGGNKQSVCPFIGQ